MDYTKLYFNGIDIQQSGSFLTVTPTFVCPNCGKDTKRRIETKTLFNPSVELNVNALVTFILPCCGNRLLLYVALHKTANKDDLLLCIQKSSEEGSKGISSDWYLPIVVEPP